MTNVKLGFSRAIACLKDLLSLNNFPHRTSGANVTLKELEGVKVARCHDAVSHL